MIDKLRKEFENVYFSNVSTTKGLENLAINIGISKNSLRRFLGKIKNESLLRNSTLNLISERLGYKSFRDFCENSNSDKPTMDFELLDIYYGSVKGKGTSLNENRFQKANYYFAQKILSNPIDLKEFVKRFFENEEALEYVVAWHPSYGHIAQENYQDALLKLAKISSKAHVKVFAYAFIYFGKFMSEQLKIDEADHLMKMIEKSVIKMRKESGEFMVFPEARYSIAKHIHTFLHSVNIGTAKISGFKFRNIDENRGESFADQIVFCTYVSNLLNILKQYEMADQYFTEIPSEKQLQICVEENQHLKPQLYLYKITRATMLFKMDKREEALRIFDTLPIDINDSKSFSFDSKIYFELQYYYLGKQLFPERKDFKERFQILVERTQFTYFNTI